MTRLIHHVKSNVVAYVALFFAIGGGGVGAAVAATVSSSNAIHACVNKKNRALYVAKKCTSAESALTFNRQGPVGKTGATAPVAYGQVGETGNAYYEQGMVITQVTTGAWQVRITAKGCAGVLDQVPVVSPVGSSVTVPANNGGGIPVVYDAGNERPGTFEIQAGLVQNGTFVFANQAFNIIDECVPAAS